MRISPKVILLIVCALTGAFFYQGCQKEAEVTVKPAPAKEVTAAPIPEKEGPVVPEEVKAPAAEPNAVEPAVETNDVAVTVNGSDIMEAEVDAQIKPHLSRVARQMDPSIVEQYKSRMRGQVLEIMITERLLDEQVKKADITVTDSDVNDRISEITTQQGVSIDAFRSMLEARGQDFKQFKQQMKQGLGYEKLVDRQAGVVDINDAEALAYYEENKEDYNTPEQVQASHILIKPDLSIADANDAKAKALGKARDILKQVKAGGDFAALAKENSDCPSKTKGGDLGFFGRGNMVKPFEDAAFALQTGQVSDVVETPFGYHIIKTTGRKPAGLTPFEKARPDIVKMLEQMKKGRIFKQYVEKLKAEAEIVYPPGKEPMLNRPMMPPRRAESPTPAPE